MKKIILAAAISLAFVGTASAGGFLPDVNTTNNVPMANATAGAAAMAGAAANAQQAQGQLQGQLQGQGQQQGIASSITSSPTSTSGGNILQNGSASTSTSGGNILTSGSTSNNGGNTQRNDGNNASTSVAVGGDVYQASRIPVATAYAAPLAATAACMGSSSGGIQGMSVGVSIGSTWVDKNCQLLEQVRAASNIGEQEVAQEMMMSVPAFAEARQRIADRKSGKTVSRNTTGVNAPKVATASPAYTDPIIRSRLGLPPLAATK